MFEKEILTKNVAGLSEEQAEGVMTLITNTSKVYNEKLINKTIGEQYGKLDAMLAENGFERKEGKTNEFLISKLKEAQTNSERIAELQKELETAKPGGIDKLKKEIEDLKSGSPFKSELDLLRQQLNGSKEAYEKLKVEKEKEIQQKETSAQLDFIKYQLMASMPKTKNDIPENISKLTKEHAINNILKTAFLDSEKKVNFKKEDGTLLLNPDNANAPYSITEMFLKDDFFKEIAEVGNKQTGAGIKDKFTNNIPKISNYKTKEELKTALREEGLTGEKFQTAYNEHVKNIK